MKKINWAELRNTLRADLVALPHFLKNPVQGMRELPNWDWPTILILQAAFALLCSLIGNLLERDFFGLVTGIVVAPLANISLAAVGAGFFYYFAVLVLKREVSYRHMYLHVLFASIPLMLTTIVDFLVPPLILIGTAAFFLLLYVGFVDNFHFPRKPLRNFFALLMLVYFVYWGFERVQSSSKHKSLRLRATPESLDILEKELKQ